MNHESILFLDVDGVLNRCGVSGQGLETDMVAQLKRIVDACNPRVVVSSTWRLKEHQMDRLRRLFASLGARYAGVTPDLSCSEVSESGICLSRPRHQEIEAYMRDYFSGESCTYVILDDDSREMGPLTELLVKTDSYAGLTEEKADEVILRFQQGVLNT